MGTFTMCRSWSTTRAARVLAVAVTILVLAGGGCVERRLIIRTNPPGALAYVDDNEVGLTPVAISPIYYGSRKIRLVKDGCETLTVIQSVPPPWYEVPPLDFFSETLVPGKLRDVRTYDYQLRPQGVVPQEELLARAENLRRGTQTVPGIATPGYRVNPPSRGPIFTPAPGTPGGPPIGGQPYYQLPPGTSGPAVPAEPIYTPPPSTSPVAPPASGPIYQPPPSMPPAAPAGPSNVGSQPYFPLP
ncbi:MAG: PEGA domain-containing protein [Planctomycetota bacterium]